MRKAEPINRSRLIVRYLLLGIFVVILLYAVFRQNGVIATIRLKQEFNRIERENARLRDEIAQMSAETQKLKHDSRYLELLALQNGWIRPGENVILLPSGTAVKPIDNAVAPVRPASR